VIRRNAGGGTWTTESEAFPGEEVITFRTTSGLDLWPHAKVLKRHINIHICHRNDSVHKDSLVFMDILNRRPDLRRKYEAAKDRAHSIDPANPEIYNREKDAVIREIHDEARGSDAHPDCYVLRS
jgi:GrpB-like predicted nucleotidyltransferase (UPF0157 family)